MQMLFTATERLVSKASALTFAGALCGLAGCATAQSPTTAAPAPAAAPAQAASAPAVAPPPAVTASASIAQPTPAPLPQVIEAERQVRQRADQRWKALIAGDLRGAWALHSPGWRAVNPYEGWREELGTSLRWLNAEATSAQCELALAERCTVQVKVLSELRGLPIRDIPRESVLVEAWIRVDGQWWHAPVPVRK